MAVIEDVDNNWKKDFPIDTIERSKHKLHTPVQIKSIGNTAMVVYSHCDRNEVTRKIECDIRSKLFSVSENNTVTYQNVGNVNQLSDIHSTGIKRSIIKSPAAFSNHAIRNITRVGYECELSKSEDTVFKKDEPKPRVRITVVVLEIMVVFFGVVVGFCIAVPLRVCNRVYTGNDVERGSNTALPEACNNRTCVNGESQPASYRRGWPQFIP